MGAVRIDLRKTMQLADRINSFGKDLNLYSGHVEHIANNLKKNSIISNEIICEKLSLQNQNILMEAEKLKNMSDALRRIVARYAEAEKNITGFPVILWGFPDHLGLMPAMDWKPIIPHSIVYSPKKDNSWEKKIKDLIDRLKSILKGLDKIGDKSRAGQIEKIIAYFEDLIKFLKGDKSGCTGIGNWCKLTDSSIDVWKKFYDYCVKQFGTQETGLFTDIAQKYVKVFGVTAGIMGLFSSIFSATSGGDSKTLGERIAEYIGCGKDVITTIKAQYELSNIKNATSLAKTKAGPWSALDIYTNIGSAVVDTISQGVRSIEKYLADGNWTVGDTGATGVDAAMSGLYGLANKFTYGMDNIIFDFVYKASGGKGTPTMNYGQMAAEGYKALANEAGEALGNLWKKLTKR